MQEQSAHARATAGAGGWSQWQSIQPAAEDSLRAEHCVLVQRRVWTHRGWLVAKRMRLMPGASCTCRSRSVNVHARRPEPVQKQRTTKSGYPGFTARQFFPSVADFF